MRWVVLAYDIILIAAVVIDARYSRLPKGLHITREFGGRFAVGAETEVQIKIQNARPRPISLIIKDEYPPQMKVSSLRQARLRLPRGQKHPRRKVPR